MGSAGGAAHDVQGQDTLAGWCEQRDYTCRMVKKAVQQGRSEVHGAKNNERHVCGRRRDGEAAVSEMLITFVHAREMVSGPDHGAKNNERHACGRRRDGEPAVS